MTFWAAGAWEMNSLSSCPLRMWSRLLRWLKGFALPSNTHHRNGFIPPQFLSALRIFLNMASLPTIYLKLQKPHLKKLRRMAKTGSSLHLELYVDRQEYLTSQI